MATSTNPGVDLVSLFGTVAKTLTQNQTAMNDSDTYNHDHGDNMVQIFNVITQAMKEKKDSTPADQLAHASQILQNQSSSGSAQIYSEGLSDAAKTFAGKSSLSAENITQLVQLLLGAAPAASTTQDSSSSGGDLIGAILGGLSGAGTSTNSNTTAPTQNDQGTFDVGDLVNAGLTFFQTKESGGSTMTALMNAISSSSKVGSQDYRTQSGALVAQTLINAVTKMVNAKK